MVETEDYSYETQLTLLPLASAKSSCCTFIHAACYLQSCIASMSYFNFSLRIVHMNEKPERIKGEERRAGKQNGKLQGRKRERKRARR